MFRAGVVLSLSLFCCCRRVLWQSCCPCFFVMTLLVCGIMLFNVYRCEYVCEDVKWMRRRRVKKHAGVKSGTSVVRTEQAHLRRHLQKGRHQQKNKTKRSTFFFGWRTDVRACHEEKVCSYLPHCRYYQSKAISSIHCLQNCGTILFSGIFCFSTSVRRASANRSTGVR